MPQVRWSETGDHPEGEFDARLLKIRVNEGEQGPFGGWAQFIFQTEHGFVATLLSLLYSPGTDLDRLARHVLGRAPEILGFEDLEGAAVPIRVTHERQHGALCAVASLDL